MKVMSKIQLQVTCQQFLHITSPMIGLQSGSTLRFEHFYMEYLTTGPHKPKFNFVWDIKNVLDSLETMNSDGLS